MIAVEIDKKTGEIINTIVVEPGETTIGDRLLIVVDPIPDPTKYLWNGSEFVLNAVEQAKLEQEQIDYNERLAVLAKEIWA